MRFIKTFKIFESEVLSKRQQKNKEWHERNPDPKGEILTPEEVLKYGVPEKIVNMMRDWDVIYKSPYSKSFYSSDDISWTHKPDNSYRVSDHWNFTTYRTNNLHCKTDKPVPNNTHYAIGIYDKKLRLYKILDIEETEQFRISKIEKEAKLKYLRDPEVISRKKEFKNSINNGEIFAEIIFKSGHSIFGKVEKYTGFEIRIIDESGKKFSEPYIGGSSIKNIKLSDKEGNKIEDLFKI